MPKHILSPELKIYNSKFEMAVKAKNLEIGIALLTETTGREPEYADKLLLNSLQSSLKFGGIKGENGIDASRAGKGRIKEID